VTFHEHLSGFAGLPVADPRRAAERRYALGALRDEDAAVLLDVPAFRSLELLDLHHHFLSEDMAERVRAEFAAAGVDVDLSEPKDPYDLFPDEPFHYTAVSE
jgi:hypothetical protein